MPAVPIGPSGEGTNPAPDKVGAAKTIQITNNASETIDPLLRGVISGKT
ncbi:hypothetical protein [Tautonia marina]|nr:hypothetical protein [Tautonia marina]